MAKRKRRAFTREFKAEAVRLVRERGKSVPNARARTSGRTSARGPRDHAHHDAVRRRDPRRGGPRSPRGRRASEEGDGLGASAGRRTRGRLGPGGVHDTYRETLRDADRTEGRSEEIEAPPVPGPEIGRAH